jgi:hypothetical protein
VDVIVRNGSDEGTLSGGYEYAEDASGKGGGLGYVEWYDVVGFLSTSSSWTDFGFASLLLPTSTSMHYWDLYASSSDTCQSEFSATLDFEYVYDFGVTSLSLRSGGSSLTLPLDTSTLWFDAGELSTSIPASTSFNLVFPSGSGFDDFAVTGMVVMPSSAPTVSTPNLSSSSPPNISATQVFSWSPSGGDKALIMLQLFDSSGASVRETVTCVVNDDGSFNVPSSTFRLWQRGNPMAIYVGRVEESTATLPWNGGQSRIAGVLWTVGQGTAN